MAVAWATIAGGTDRAVTIQKANPPSPAASTVTINGRPLATRLRVGGRADPEACRPTTSSSDGWVGPRETAERWSKPTSISTTGGHFQDRELPGQCRRGRHDFVIELTRKTWPF